MQTKLIYQKDSQKIAPQPDGDCITIFPKTIQLLISLAINGDDMREVNGVSLAMVHQQLPGVLGIDGWEVGS